MFLVQARDKLKMQDALRLYEADDEGRLLATHIRMLDEGYRRASPKVSLETASHLYIEGPSAQMPWRRIFPLTDIGQNVREVRSCAAWWIEPR